MIRASKRWSSLGAFMARYFLRGLYAKQAQVIRLEREIQSFKKEREIRKHSLNVNYVRT